MDEGIFEYLLTYLYYHNMHLLVSYYYVHHIVVPILSYIRTHRNSLPSDRRTCTCLSRKLAPGEENLGAAGKREKERECERESES